MERYRALRNETLGAILRDNFGRQSLSILEVGCGTGLSLEYLARDEARHSLFGVDASDTMLRQTAQRIASFANPARLLLGDAAHLPYRGAFFDVVFATRFIHQFEHEVKKQLRKEFERVLKPGGLLILEFYARPYHWVRYQLGAGKGKDRSTYFIHYPSRREVSDVIGGTFRVYPLRLLGSRLLVQSLTSTRARRVTELGGRVLGGVLLDEYFVASRRR